VRLATAVAAVSLLILVGVLSLQEQQGQFVAASSAEPITIILTPTPQPATATPVPTVSIQLTPWVTPDPTTGGGVIAFAQTVEGNSDIYVLPVGQSEPVRVTTHPAPDKDPIWSPDGTQIAFTSRRDGNWDVYVYTIPEGRLRRVTRGLDYDGAPTWSPDSQWLAYESYQDGNLDIYLVKADASEGPFRLTYHSAPDFAPAWSPDGRYMAFTSWRSGNQDIFVQSLDDPQGDRVTNVTQSPAVHEDGAAFSPDGRYLAYFEHSAGFPIVFTQPLDEMNAPVGEPVSLGQQGEMPAWSPDSQSLIYVHEKNGRAYLVAGSLEAWGVAPQVFTAPGQLQSPSWTAVNLSPSMARTLEHIDGSPKDGPLYVEAIARPERGRAPVLLWELPVNAPMPYLSDQVDQSFEALRERVIVEAGWDFLGQLDGMFEDIEAKPLPGQSVESWSKAGRAFDLYYRDALGFEPKVFVTREEVGPETYWRVFIKTAVQDGSQGEPLTVLTWDFQARTGDDPQYYLQGGKWSEAVPAGYFVDFTALAADYGWSRVSANENWRTFFPDIRFWHYEKQQNLTWIEAMQQLYTESELAAVVEP
jgi:TolB protein